ncbi:MAG: CoB--CoM heterodisulfide reductase subunit B [Methanofollis liminatans]|jgi:heterodisulfide reductase subunit B|uniref:CoB/CoM heterodisulfide reductase, subunit B n=1 Tax=Methanofollis liminatans DSM 4140 TaxID=28892 RepID=J1L0G1_9EURY|nr:CoB--CoM heterodisulfide reductase subunit B [Methanofollis liminatans]EJG06477.1 CoB/CoM heterodisulfide reductase, subunit B [Methanofollis liminatans DSM 4140]MDD3110906.1 CoB--CoM heterodisulfide reductase subunit B [Methanofollis liminatans]
MHNGMHEYAFFLGCIAPNRYPGCEAAAIKTSRNVGIELLPLKGASCCPAPGAFGAVDLSVWYAMAARNIILAEEMGKDIALICNGCYKSIYEVNERLKEHDDLRDQVNEVLAEVDMEFKGTIDVYHLAELYYDPKICGVEKIRESVVRPLDGTKIAVHYGCHLLKPIKERRFTDAENPMWIEELVDALGAESVQYRNKMQCCGAGGGVRGFDLAHSLDITNEKLINVTEAGADAITEVCPFCQLQYDRGQIEIKEKFGIEWNIPVLHYNELLGLAQGMSPQELALDLHGIDCKPFLDKIL